MQPSYPLPPIRLLHIHQDGFQNYKAAIDQHAEVRWDGIAEVKEQGRRIWALPPAKLETLRQCLEKYDFLNLDRKDDDGLLIPPCIDPDPGKFTLTVIFTDGSSKTLVHDHNFMDLPKAFWRLERRIETLLGVRKYAGKLPLLE